MVSTLLNLTRLFHLSTVKVKSRTPAISMTSSAFFLATQLSDCPSDGFFDQKTITSHNGRLFYLI